MFQFFKKYGIYSILGILFSLFLFLFFIRSCSAYTLQSSSITYGYDLNINQNDYYNINLIALTNVPSTTVNGVTYSINNGVMTLNGTSTVEFNIEFPLENQIVLNGGYVLSAFNDITYTNGLFLSTKSGVNYTVWMASFNSSIYINNSNTTTTLLSTWIPAGTTFNNNTIKPMLVKGTDIPITYSTFYKIGYYVSWSVYGKSATLGNQVLNLYAYDNVTLTNRYISSCNLDITKVNVPKTCYNNELVYIPFNIVDNKIISDYTFTFSYSGSRKTDMIYYSVDINLKPVYNFTNVEGNNNIFITSNMYSYNNIFYKDLSITTDYSIVSSISSNFLQSASSSGSYYFTFNGSKSNSLFDNNCLLNDYVIDSTFTNRISADYLSTYYFSKNTILINNGSSSINDFSINTSFTSLTLYSRNGGGISPLPPSSLVNYQKYESCSGWYDLPCQLSNGFTYVVYNNSVTSPVFKLLDNATYSFNNVLNIFDSFSTFDVLISVAFFPLIWVLIKKLYGNV